AVNCPSISPEWQNPNGVPIDAIIFGARRRAVVPLVYEARDWQHGTFLGATLRSETTAAAVGKVGVLRRDPMAMVPFCGYNMADYWQHWLSIGTQLRSTGTVPRIFQVNWFRKDSDGDFLWPGFGDNSRVLAWILDRVDGQVAADDSPLGLLPRPGDINTDGLNLSAGAFSQLFEIDPTRWLAEVDDTERFFDTFEGKVPVAVLRQLSELRLRLQHMP
ncbi:MAG TPA: phosphoenolpyruvate carboxykinase domain-containing protein, partial [Glaciihabitans sp.]|nr:phosphoenolpyruvate carboxykinase domain-containing protein [Glaciihabitans sp.]